MLGMFRSILTKSVFITAKTGLLIPSELVAVTVFSYYYIVVVVVYIVYQIKKSECSTFMKTTLSNKHLRQLRCARKIKEIC